MTVFSSRTAVTLAGKLLYRLLMEAVKFSSFPLHPPTAGAVPAMGHAVQAPWTSPDPRDAAAAPGAVDEAKPISEADQLLKSLEFEMARKRAQRVASASSNRGSLRALSMLMLLMLLGAAFYALWQLQALRDSRRPAGTPTAGAITMPAGR